MTWPQTQWTEQFEAQRPMLTALCYRMLGERGLAEDAVQDTWLKWSTADHAAIRTPAAWLRTAATRVAIDSLRRAKARRETYVGPWLPEPLIVDTHTAEDSFAQAQDCELALLWMMDTLPSSERAAFVLREAFDASYADIADTLGKSEAACRQLVSRAHRRIAQSAPDLTQPAGKRAAQISGFLAAIATGDLDAAKAYLSDDAIAISDGGAKARAARRPLVGPDDILLVSHAVSLKHASTRIPVPVTANGYPALLMTDNGVAHTLFTVALNRHGQICWMYTMRNPDKLWPALANRVGGRASLRQQTEPPGGQTLQNS
ncbi:RNA polymerase sigma factor SigJ [Tateyamaria omphalii]|uniref:RNA polymerase sigma factor SigJ n=1 Tax=Tateyamaria omphalii TaxID=299262 RepID=UPI001C993138|nr:RNA polymerase sigma factor SigJ [Tateyamaria omphalii]MBY5932118.1 RNA polymerase sigma factor SigJ [Tateyamaria omphalii]